MRRLAVVGMVLAAVTACSSDDDDASPAASTAPAGATSSEVADTPPASVSTTPTGTMSSDTPASVGTTSATTTTTTPTSTTATSTLTTNDPPENPTFVETSLGPVGGTMSDDPSVRAFLAMPYAAPPTGENRWRPPQPHDGWSRLLKATTPGASCPQPTDGVVSEFLITPASKEDCLTLSVWSPMGAEGLPVMVFFHGGGFSTGSAHQPYYIGDRLSGTGAVVVNVNYRLGALGFLAADVLAEGGDGPVGNYGLADQVAALEWVRDNAAAFGGDAGNVTIFGESAGGFSVCGHLASPQSQGLFHKAIIQSGGGCHTLQSAEAAAVDGAELLAAVGCDDLACLRRVPARRLVAGGFSPGLVADGDRLETSAYEQAVAGTLADIPVLTGSNADESTLFTLGAEEPTDDGLLTQFAATFDDPQAVAALYPDGEFDTNLKKQQAHSTEMAFTCPALRFAAATPQGYAYYYSYVSPGNPFGLGATHGAELAFVFGHPEGIRSLPARIDEGSRRLSRAMQEMWVEFAGSGSPGPRYAPLAEAGEIIELTRPVGVTEEIRDGRCRALADLLR